MHFEFDARKDAANLLKHGIGLADAARVLLDPDRLDLPVGRKDYGEERRIVVGAIARRVLVVVYTWRGDAVRLISARRANEREQKRYHALRD